jgi:hypothetical protein
VTENTHLTPQCPGIGGALGLLVTGSFREAMMGGLAFFLLKAGRAGPESAKQAEIRLANLLKIVDNRPLRGESLARVGFVHAMVVAAAISAGYG